MMKIFHSSPEKLKPFQTQDSNSWDTQTDIYHTARSRFTQRLLKEIELSTNNQATDSLNGNSEYGSAKSHIQPNKASRKNSLAYSLFSKCDTASFISPEIGTSTRNTLITRFKQDVNSSNVVLDMSNSDENSDETKLLPAQERLLVQNVADGLFTVGTVAIRYANNDQFKQYHETQNKENEVTPHKSDLSLVQTVTLENSLAICRSVLANCKTRNEIYQFLERLEKEILDFLLTMYPKDAEVVKRNFADIYNQAGNAQAKLHTVLEKEQQSPQSPIQLPKLHIQDDTTAVPNENKEGRENASNHRDKSKLKHITIEPLIAEIDNMLNALGFSPDEKENEPNEYDEESDFEHTKPLFFEGNKDENIKSNTKSPNRKRHFSKLINWWLKDTKSNPESQNQESHTLDNENAKTNSSEEENNEQLDDDVVGDQMTKTPNKTDPFRSHFKRINSTWKIKQVGNNVAGEQTYETQNYTDPFRSHAKHIDSTLTLAEKDTRNSPLDTPSQIQSSVYQPETPDKKQHLSKLFETGQKTQNKKGAIVSFIEEYEQSNNIPLNHTYEKQNYDFSYPPHAKMIDLTISQFPEPDLGSMDSTKESTLYDDVVGVHLPKRISYGLKGETTTIQERFEFWARFGDPGWLDEVNKNSKPLADNWVVRLLDKYKDYQANRYLAKHPPPPGY
ncbi:unnamed protein product [Ambrosiozyma monospora]|uniref:Unnamed protein product n=1 Tax=Ambrosiozyma monospora TaxID=43982 RepID=A0ACB5STN7_AMBMO|nr:unnamed protein product [Ambrosiozyma monospora]